MSKATLIRRSISAVVAAAVVVAVVVVVSQAADSGSAAPVTTASPLTAQTATRGDLVKTSKADGTLEYSDTLTVWHRIDGQKATASSSTGNSGGNQGAGQFAGPGGGSPRAVHSPAQVSTPSSTTCTPSSSTVPPSSSTPGSSTPGPVAPAAVDPCSSPGGGNGGGAARPGGGVASGSNGTSAQIVRITQIVTSITSAGRAIGNGDVLYTIDSEPVIALIGALPAWRTLSVKSSAGADVRQLEQALVDLGYDPDGTVTVDEAFDANTEAMVKRWQTGLGITSTGTVSLGSVVFIPRRSTVATVARTVGDEVGDADEMLTLAGKSQRIVIDVPTGDEEHWVPGLPVTVGGTAGKVIVLQSVDRNSTAIVQAVIVPDALIEGANNGATLTVSAELLIASDVLVVPSQALVSRVDGSYALQVVGGDGAVSWVPVTLEGVAGLRAGVLPVDDGGSKGASAAAIDDGTTILAPSA